MTLGELVVNLLVKADTFTVRDFSKAMGDIPFSVASALTSMAGLSIGFAEMTKQVLDMTTGFSVFTAETGLNSRALQQWQQVAKQAGLSGDVVTGSLTSLSNLMGQMRTGHVNGAAMTALGQLGVRNFSASPYEMLSKIQAGAMGMNPQAATALLQAVGISPEMMRVFQTPAGVREGMKPVMSQGEIEQMAEFQKSLANFSQVTMREFAKALTEIEPYMKDLTEVLTDLIKLSGEGAHATLGEIHGALRARHAGVGWITGDATPYFPPLQGDRNVTVNNEHHYHIASNADPMAIADEAARLSKKQEYRKAAADIANRGN